MNRRRVIFTSVIAGHLLFIQGCVSTVKYNISAAHFESEPVPDPKNLEAEIRISPEFKISAKPYNWKVVSSLVFPLPLPIPIPGGYDDWPAGPPFYLETCFYPDKSSEQFSLNPFAIALDLGVKGEYFPRGFFGPHDLRVEKPVVNFYRLIHLSIVLNSLAYQNLTGEKQYFYGFDVPPYVEGPIEKMIELRPQTWTCALLEFDVLMPTPTDSFVVRVNGVSQNGEPFGIPPINFDMVTVRLNEPFP